MLLLRLLPERSHAPFLHKDRQTHCRKTTPGRHTISEPGRLPVPPPSLMDLPSIHHSVRCRRRAPFPKGFRHRTSAFTALKRPFAPSRRAQETQRKADQEAIAGSFNVLNQQFTASIEALQRAQQSQQEQLVQSMNELKSLVLNRTSEPSKKRSADKVAEKMDWEPDDKS